MASRALGEARAKLPEMPAHLRSVSDTIINTQIKGATKEKPFKSNIGSPQGDSLSPVLFSIYLENDLKEVRTILPRLTSDFEKTLPTEIVYARRRRFLLDLSLLI